MVDSDTSILISIFAYFIVLTVGLTGAGFGAHKIYLPTSPGGLTSTATQQPVDDQQGFLIAIMECAVTFGVIPGVGFALGLVDALGVDVPFVDCTRQTSSSFARVTESFFDGVADVAIGFFRFATSSLMFLWQLGTMQIEGPGIFGALLVWPPFIAMAFIFIRTVRGFLAG